MIEQNLQAGQIGFILGLFAGLGFWVGRKVFDWIIMAIKYYNAITTRK